MVGLLFYIWGLKYLWFFLNKFLDDVMGMKNGNFVDEVGFLLCLLIWFVLVSLVNVVFVRN